MTSLTDENEAAAVAAMFKATSENWEQTQEKMSQFVFFHTLYVYYQNNKNCRCVSFSFFVCDPLSSLSRAVPIYNNARGTGRGGKPFVQPTRHQPERPLPASYVCYRCGQKGEG